MKIIANISNIHITRDIVNAVENFLSQLSPSTKRKLTDIMIFHEILNNLLIVLPYYMKLVYLYHVEIQES